MKSPWLIRCLAACCVISFVQYLLVTFATDEPTSVARSYMLEAILWAILARVWQISEWMRETRISITRAPHDVLEIRRES